MSENCSYQFLSVSELHKHMINNLKSKTDVTRIRRNRRLMRQRAMEAMTGDSHIDRVSRVMFPLTFFLFNVVYWFAYLSHRQAEIVHNTVDHKNDHN